jgi:OOP family OmpA-OmpF porin
MPESKFVPFVAIGAGGSTITDATNINVGRNRIVTHGTNNDATAQAGIGFKYFLGEDLALRADTRAIMSFHATPAFEISRNEYWINYEYTLGVQFLFGGKKPVVAKVVPPPPPPAPKPVEPPPPAPVDCQVSAWSDWSSCSALCGGGTQTRTRSITTQPANGGAACPSLSESKSCNTQACMEEEKINLLIEFDFDKAVIKKEFYPNADAVGAFLKKNDKITITLDGWTDYIGTDKYNKKLSQRRADAVKKYLVDKHKIDAARITAVGHGKSFKYDNKTEAGRYKNRRVEMNQSVMVEKK